MSLKDKKLFLLDMDGTIYEGARLFECVNEFLAYIESVGGQYVFITNNSSRSVKDYVIKLSNMGIKVTEDNFFTSSQATALYLNKHFPNKKIYCMGTASMIAEMEKYGVNILVENFNKMCIDGLYWIDNAPDLLRMIKCVSHPLFHAVWDVGHANMQEMPQDEAIRLLGEHIFALHIHDNMGDKDSHLTPFLGTLNLDSVMNGLLDIGYDSYFTFEVGGVFVPSSKRRRYDKDTRLETAPIELRDAYERYLYELGKCILEKYNCFEE